MAHDGAAIPHGPGTKGGAGRGALLCPRQPRKVSSLSTDPCDPSVTRLTEARLGQRGLAEDTACVLQWEGPRTSLPRAPSTPTHRGYGPICTPGLPDISYPEMNQHVPEGPRESAPPWSHLG